MEISSGQFCGEVGFLTLGGKNIASDKVGGGGDQKVVGAAGPGALALAVVSQRAGVVRRVPVARVCVCVIVL